MQLKASKGLGDAVYLRAIALYLIGRGEKVEIFTPWKDVFADLPATVKGLAEITGDEDWHHGKACLHCRILSAPDLFSMACLQAGITEPVPFRIDWKVKNHDLVARIRREARSRPIAIFQPLKVAQNQNERLSRPNAGSYRRAVEGLGFFRVKVGHPQYVQPMDLPCELDLVGKTSVTDLFDICSVADSAFGEPSYVTVMAEAMDKPFTCMFSRRALDSGRVHVANLTPKRFFHKPHLATATYDEAVCAS